MKGWGRAAAVVLALAVGAPVQAQQKSQEELARSSEAELLAAREARAQNPNRPSEWWAEVSRRPDGWYATAEGRRIAANILSWQDRAVGGWPLMNTTREPFTGDVSRAGPWGTRASMIKASVNEIRFMARAWRATGDERYARAAREGIGFILAAQYPSGGWPHSYPVRDDYTRWATFNDDMAPDLMRLLNEVARGQDFAGFDAALKARAKASFDKGVDFILKSQVRQGGRLTVWCQQHDPVTYQCRPARTFEPAAISGGESASVLSLLMDIDDPSPAVKAAIRAGAEWYRASAISGLRLTYADGDRVVTPDPAAPALWARFYDASGRPIFSGRDGVIRYALADIEKERRGGYAWYNQNGTAVLARYGAWRAAHHG